MRLYKIKIEPRSFGLFDPVVWSMSARNMRSASVFAFTIFRVLHKDITRRMIKITVSRA